MRKVVFTVNKYGVCVKKGCHSCAYKKITSSQITRICTRQRKKVKRTDVCRFWEMNECLREFRISNS